MKFKRYVFLSAALLLFSGMIALNSCSDVSTARVTIHLQANEQAFAPVEKSWIDRVLGLFSTGAHAVTWQSNYDELTLTINGPGMSTITTQIPPATTSYTVEIPAGRDRLIIIMATNSAIGKNYGGMVKVELQPGEQRDLNVFMIPIPIINGTNGVFCVSGNVEIFWETPTIGNIQGYYIYRADNINGPYVKVDTVVGGGTSFYSGSDPGMYEGAIYYYRVSAYNQNGESAPTDPIMVELLNNC